MIETKEQYEMMRVLLPHIDFTDEGPTHFDIMNTIEALRKVARAGRIAQSNIGIPGDRTPAAIAFAWETLEEALLALPDWIFDR